MSGRADKVAVKALAALKKHGQQATLTRTVAGAYDVATASVGPATTSTNPVHLMVQADSGQDNEGDSLVKDGTVRTARRKLLVAAGGLAVVPAPGDEVGPLEGRAWTVLATDPPVQLGGTPILYTLRVAST